MAIQIIQEKRRLNQGQKFGQAIGAGLSSGAQSYVEKLRRDEEDQAIERETGANLSGIRDPQTRQSLMQDQLKQGRRYREAGASHKLHKNFSDQLNPQNRSQSFQNRLQESEPLGIYDQEREPDPVIRDMPYEEAPRNQSKKTKKVSLEPQTETQGQKFQRLNPNQIREAALKLQEESLDTPNPLRYDEAENIVLNNQNNIGTYNQGVENERITKQNHQRDYGNQAIASLEKVFPEATDEHRALMQKYAEEAASNNVDESSFQREVSKRATKFKNDLTNLIDSFPPPRKFNDLKGGLLGNTRKAEEAKADIRVKLKPLLKEGMFDTARLALKKAGYAPEEREAILTDLSESTSKIISNLPDFNIKTIKHKNPDIFSGLPTLEQSKQFPEESLQDVDNSLIQIFKDEPKVNLVLLRKAFEDKKVDWRTFKNQMNKLVLNGDIQLDDDQFNQFNSYIDNPPEGPLDYIMRKLGFGGR